jgi:serine/threonine-protein kinase
MTALSEITPGTYIGDRYRIQNLLGQGGFGRTYLVSDRERFWAQCVLKEFLPARSEENIVQKSLELFQREAKVLQKLDHPQIPQFLDWFEDRGRICIVQEYIEGKNYWQLLRERLSLGQVFSEAEILQWLKDLLPVLDYLHGCYVIHRDIAPDNIMLCWQSGKPILIDLGIVKEAVTQGYYSYMSNSRTLGSVSLVGKRGYSPPEQMLMGQCYPNSDLYSLAVTALVLLTGRSPTELFDSHSMEWQWHNYVQLSDELEGIFRQMLAEKPKERYQSAKEVLAVLPEFLGDCGSSTPILTSVLPEDEPTALFSSELAQTLEELDPPPQDRLIHEEREIKPSNKKRKPLIISGTIAAGVLVSSVVFAIQAPFNPLLCKKLNNCTRDAQYQNIYQEYVDRSTEAIAKSKQAQSLEELQTVQNQLGQSLTQLKTIPNDVKVSPQAQQTYKEYQTQLAQINARVAKEQQAEQKLKQAESLIKSATKDTETAQTLPQYQQAKTQWDRAQEHLKAIPSDAVVAGQAQTYLLKSNAKITEIQTQIEQKVKTVPTQQPQQITQQRSVQRAVQSTPKAKTTPTRTTAVQKAPSRSSTVKRSVSRTTQRTRVTRSSTVRRSQTRVYRQTTPTRAATPRRSTTTRQTTRTTSRRIQASVRRSPSRSSLWGKSSSRSSRKKSLW